MLKVNYHTHSCYCDGKGEPEAYVQYAIQHQFTHLGFSGHAPVPFANTFAIATDCYPEYCQKIRLLQSQYADQICIRLGLEIDYIPGVMEDFDSLIKKGKLDYFIGSVHQVNKPNNDPMDLWFIDGSKQETYDEGLQRVFGGNIRQAVRQYFDQLNQMIVTKHPPIVGHFDKVVMHNRNRYFDPEEHWFLDLAFETASLMRENGCIYEINTRGLYKGRHTDFYPSRTIIKHLANLRLPVIVGTDAHQPADLDRFEKAYEFLNEIGYPEIVYEV